MQRNSFSRRVGQDVILNRAGDLLHFGGAEVEPVDAADGVALGDEEESARQCRQLVGRERPLGRAAAGDEGDGQQRSARSPKTPKDLRNR